MDMFGSRLRERAAQLKISNAEAARRIGLSERRYAHYVSGVREPDLATLVRIASGLLTTPNALLGVDALPKLPKRNALLDRIISAAAALSDEELKVVAVQTEALAASRGQDNG